jgi:hypothetical protein
MNPDVPIKHSNNSLNEIIPSLSSGQLRILYCEARSQGSSNADAMSKLCAASGKGVSECAASIAWLKIHGKKMLKALGEKPEKDDVHEVISLSYAIYSGQNTDQISEKVSALSAKIGVTGAILTESLKTLSQKLFESGRIKRAPSLSEDDSFKRVSIKGDRAEYNKSASKLLWHEAYLNFLNQRLSKENAANGWVLTNPGVKPDSMISIFDSLGFRRERIIAVEGGSDGARGAFLENCKRLGIKGLTGKFHEIIPTLKQRFMLVDMDSIGQVSGQMVKAVHAVPLADKAFVMLNVRIGRESKFYQDQLYQIAKQTELGQAIKELTEDAFKRGIGGEGVARAYRQSDLQKYMTKDIENSGLRDIRDETLDSALLTNVSTGASFRHGHWREGAFDDFDFSDARNELFGHCDHVEREIFALVSQVSYISPHLQLPSLARKKGQVTLPVPTGGVRKLIIGSLFQDYKITDIKKVGYKSDIGSGRSIFHSTFAEVECPRRVYENWTPITKVLMDVIVPMLNDSRAGQQTPYQFFLGRNKFLRGVRPPGSKPGRPVLDRGTTITFRREGVTIAGPIPVHTLFRNLFQAIELQKKYPKDRPAAMAELQRDWLA